MRSPYQHRLLLTLPIRFVTRLSTQTAVVLRVLLMGASLSLFMPALSLADSSDRDRAHQALLDGKILPLSTILDRVNQDFPGDPIEIEFEDDDQMFFYEIKLLQPNGAILKIKVDARRAEVFKVQGRHILTRRNH